MAAVVAEIVVGAGGRGDWVETARGGWDEPTQANARGERLDCGETAGLDEVDADGVGAGEAVGSGAVEVGSRLREAGKEVGVAVLTSLSGTPCKCVRRGTPTSAVRGRCAREPW